MPVFGKSLFETVLDGMAVEEVEEDDAPIQRSPRVAAHFLADTAISDDVPGVRDPGRAFGTLYENFDPPPPAEPEPPAVPAWLERLSEAEIAEDLGLTDGMSLSEIKARRRSFARLNHPDGVAEAFREAATIRMTIANRLIEQALRRA